ncbi:unnamed protein product [Nippostrongylus brasiliensis]|uniref:Chitin-binding type-2 domain-containing protein n=1 Tax=Nippostrongylus brasiliensis TaxID=27835 RepID=A0A0N4YF01_NIPBR|nr:unnamed protein product [Nippostrongylus brasiliensis]
MGRRARGWQQQQKLAFSSVQQLHQPPTPPPSAMQCRVYPLLVTALFIVNPCLCQTPVIGGTCRLGTADVQIGGKQTQFFLKCEATSESAAGDGVWVVKSRAATTSATTPTVTISQPMSGVPLENTLPQQHPKLMRKQPNICEQDIDARESDSCAVSATCLQATHDIPSSYLQCDQTSLRWMRKSCQDGFVFNFEQQTCIVPKRMNSLSHVCPDGTVASGTCPCADGYVCTSQLLCCPLASSASSCPAPCSPNCPPNMASTQILNSNCVGCAPSMPPQVYAYLTCPSGSPAVGGCINGGCATGYSCIQNQCCAVPVTKNPFVCPNGNQAAGGCVNGQCGAGYTCQNGLCCLGTTASGVRCLDVPNLCAAAVQAGPCNAGTCSTGYTCNTYADICCPTTTTVFGRLRPGNNRRPTYGRPLVSYKPHLKVNDSPMEAEEKEKTSLF